MSEVGDDDGELVVVGQDVGVGEEAVFDEGVAFAGEGHFEDDGEGEGEALEEVGGWDGGAEGVEEEGGWGVGDVVGDGGLRGEEGGVGVGWRGGGFGEWVGGGGVVVGGAGEQSERFICGALRFGFCDAD